MISDRRTDEIRLAARYVVFSCRLVPIKSIREWNQLMSSLKVNVSTRYQPYQVLLPFYILCYLKFQENEEEEWKKKTRRQTSSGSGKNAINGKSKILLSRAPEQHATCTQGGRKQITKTHGPTNHIILVGTKHKRTRRIHGKQN